MPLCALKFHYSSYERSWELVGTLRHSDVNALTPHCIIGAALNIPSAMQIIVRMFPTPHVQAKAIAAFTGSGALGNGGFEYLLWL